jgi:hypothetical protein
MTTPGANAREVVRYDRDPESPGKPLHLVLPGGLVAVTALALAIVVAHRTYWREDLDEETAVWLFAILGAIYVCGAFLFSYGYRLYDLRRALLLTAFLVFFGVVLVALLAFVFIALRDVDVDLGGGGSDEAGDGEGLVAAILGSRGEGEGTPDTPPGQCPRCAFPGYPVREAPCARCGWPQPGTSPPN